MQPDLKEGASRRALRWARARSRFLARCFPLVLLCAPACAPPEPPPAAEIESPDGPKLVVLIVADQFRSDYIDRFDDLFMGGLRTLLDEGVYFENARHEHSYPATGPGHATLATGEPPRIHGIVGNGWYDRGGDWIYCAEDGEGVASPAHLRASALGDWLKARDPLAKVYSVSGKDRAAILMAGERADGAFWFDRSHGGMETSSYYYPTGTLPEWLTTYNESRPMDRYFGTLWLPLPIPDEELESRGVRDHDFGPLAKGFPYVLSSDYFVPSEQLYDGIAGTPWLDRAIGSFAETLVEAEELGADAHTDLLAIGFSALDTVGHSYGPHARETLDTLLRLDRRLQELLSFLDERVGRDNFVLAFSADHGAADVPEWEVEGTPVGTRLGSREIACLQRVERVLDKQFGAHQWLSPGPFVREDALQATGAEPAAVEQALGLAIEACPSVARVWTRSQLMGGGSGGDEFFDLYRNGYHPDVSPDVKIQWARGFLLTRHSTTTHASPYDYDLDVPLIFLVPGESARRDAAPAATMDVAPTLAAVAGIRIPRETTGRALLDP